MSRVSSLRTTTEALKKTSATTPHDSRPKSRHYDRKDHGPAKAGHYRNARLKSRPTDVRRRPGAPVKQTMEAARQRQWTKHDVFCRAAAGAPTRQPRWGGLILFAEPVLPAADAGGRLKPCATDDHGPAEAGHYRSVCRAVARSARRRVGGRSAGEERNGGGATVAVDTTRQNGCGGLAGLYSSLNLLPLQHEHQADMEA
jgi:hypothetical protein